MQNIYLYAELLLNIRQVTVFAILPSPSSEQSRISLDTDRETLHLQHNGDEAVITLPCPVTIDDSTLKIPPTSTKELSFRLDASAKLHIQIQRSNDISVPWPASQLTSVTRISCQSCGRELVANVTDWKDLPSGGWADMMDFWHCHKPTAANGNDNAADSTKGYAASNILGPTEGVGLVDITHFLFAEANCTGFRVRTSSFPLLLAERIPYDCIASSCVGNKKEAYFRNGLVPIARSPIQLP